MTEVKPDTPKICPEPECGMEMYQARVGDYIFDPPTYVCPRDADAHALCAEVARLTAANAALEEKLGTALAWISPLDKPMPVMRPMLVALLVHNIDTGAQWIEQFACFLHDEDYGLYDLADRDPLPWEPDSILLYHLLPEVDDAALEREASRKKGAEHE